MTTITRGCEGCKTEFVVIPHGGPLRRFCSRACTRKSPNAKRVEQEYIQSDRGREVLQRYTQSDRGKKQKQKSQLKYAQSDHGKETHRKYRQSDENQKTRRRYRQSDKGKAAIQRHKAKRRATKRGVFVENVDVRILLDAQGGVCFLCHQPITGEFKWPHPLSLSLDHITPLAKYGEHSYTNCAATHFRCNLVKGTKAVDDVAPLLRIVS